MRHSRLAKMMMLMGGKSRAYTDKILGTQPANMIAYWPLIGNANDISGHGFNGVAHANVTWTAGGGVDGNTCATFAGNALINCFSAGLAAAVNGQEGSMAAWVKVSAAEDWADAAWRSVVSLLRTSSNNSVAIAKTSTANRMGCYYTANAVGDAALKSDAGPSTAWIHYGMTWSLTADKVIYYFNGTAFETDTDLGTFVNPITLFLIGANDLAVGQPWKGSIQHVPIWDTPLSGDQMASLAVTTPPF